MDFRITKELLKEQIGVDVTNRPDWLTLPDAENVFRQVAEWICSERYRPFFWRECYRKVVEWVADNDRKGLLLYGSCGTGKSFVAREVLPMIFLQYHKKVLHVYDTFTMTQQTDEVKRCRFKVIDDLGTESNAKVYGQERFAFDEVIDDCEKNGKLLIVTTNLTAEQLKDKYGTRVYDRIIGNMSRVLFQGESFRNLPKFETKRKS